LPTYSEDPVAIDIAPGIIKLHQSQKSKFPLSMNQWTSAFLVFMAIYIEKKPQEAQHLLRYASSVRDLHQHYSDAAWRLYDESFRKLRHPT